MASAEYSVLTPERVSVEYGIAGVGSRAGAAIVDTTFQLIALVIYVFGLAGLGAFTRGSFNVLRDGTWTAGVLIGLFFLGLFAITSGYFILFEILWSGQTPGKRLVGVRVIRESGHPLRPVDAVIRDVVRILDWLPIGYGLGVLVMLLNGRSKRLGDFAAGTIVVREGARRALSSYVAARAEDADSIIGYTLSSADLTLVRDFLIRRATMDSTARGHLARRLAASVSRRYAIPFGSEDPEEFLERLTP
jgi:uncharacterized RDD family membrane protein YckC